MKKEKQGKLPKLVKIIDNFKRVNPKEEAHETADGWCCACEYDMIDLGNEIAEAYQKGKEEGYQEALEEVEKGLPEEEHYVGCEHFKDCTRSCTCNNFALPFNVCLSEVLELIKKLKGC